MKNLPQISDAEWEIMKILWKDSPLRALDIIKRIDNDANWKPKTVKTLIQRLVKKDAIAFEDDGNYYLYYPIVSEEECIKSENNSFLKKIYGGSLNLMFSNFLKSDKLSESEIEDLKAILNKSIDESEK